MSFTHLELNRSLRFQVNLDENAVDFVLPIHRPMTSCNNPRVLVSICAGSFQILLNPVKLIFNVLLGELVRVVVELCREVNHVDVSVIVRVVVWVGFGDRRVSAFVVSKIEVALVISRDCHVRHLI